MTCPRCVGPMLLETHTCPACGTPVAYHPPSRTLVEAPGNDIVVDGGLWHLCANRREWNCNWLVADQTSGRCFACQLVRDRPEADDTLAVEKLAKAMPDQHRLLVQADILGLPLDPWFEVDGGLAFDLLSSHSDNEPVTIGHAFGVITLDLAETLDAVREGIRARLGEAYRTMLGHYRHEIGHYFQWILVEQTGWIDECRTLFGDERESYSDAIDRHYRTGAPDDWQESFISEYATMHPWEDFAETFAHYLHITETLNTSSSAGLMLDPRLVAAPVIDRPVTPRWTYGADEFDELMRDWRWLSLFFNRVNRAMGKPDLYPFTITQPVAAKMRFVHRVLTDLPETRISPTDGFRRRIG